LWLTHIQTLSIRSLFLTSRCDKAFAFLFVKGSCWSGRYQSHLRSNTYTFSIFASHSWCCQCCDRAKKFAIKSFSLHLGVISLHLGVTHMLTRSLRSHFQRMRGGTLEAWFFIHSLFDVSSSSLLSFTFSIQRINFFSLHSISFN